MEVFKQPERVNIVGRSSAAGDLPEPRERSQRARRPARSACSAFVVLSCAPKLCLGPLAALRRCASGGGSGPVVPSVWRAAEHLSDVGRGAWLLVANRRESAFDEKSEGRLPPYKVKQ